MIPAVVEDGPGILSGFTVTSFFETCAQVVIQAFTLRFARATSLFAICEFHYQPNHAWFFTEGFGAWARWVQILTTITCKESTDCQCGIPDCTLTALQYIPGQSRLP